MNLREELAASTERTLREEARRVEVQISYARVTVLAILATIDVLAYLWPRVSVGAEWASLTNALLAIAWCLAAVVVASVLRRGWYRDSLRVFLPALDAMALFTLSLNLVWVYGADRVRTRGALMNIAAACVFVAMTGGPRFSTKAATATTGLAIGNFVVIASLVGLPPIQTGFTVGIILGAGLMAFWMTAIARRSVESEVGRTILRRFLPERVIDEAHHDPAELITEPRSAEATVVVSDLRGFTTLAERMPPNGVFEFLNEVHGALASVVHRHDGVVDKFMGDGMLAVFGAAQPLANHAESGLRAAAGIVAAMDAVNAKRTANGEAPVPVGVGVHSGVIVSGCVGSGARLEYTVIGDTVNTATRIEALTKEHGVEILTSDATAQSAVVGDTLIVDGMPWAMKPVGKTPIRGRVEPLGLHALVRVPTPMTR